MESELFHPEDVMEVVRFDDFVRVLIIFIFSLILAESLLVDGLLKDLTHLQTVYYAWHNEGQVKEPRL